MTLHPHRLATKLVKNNLGETFKYTILSLITRLIALTPLVLALLGRIPVVPPILSIVVGFISTCVLYLFLVAPLRMAYRRFFAAQASRESATFSLAWGPSLALQIKRTLRSFFCHLPLVFAVMVLYHDLKLSNALAPLRRLSSLGELPAKILGLDSALLPGAGAMVLIFILFALLSYRAVMKHVFLDMLPLSSPNPFKEAKELKKRNKTVLQKAKLGNFLLSLPFALVALYFLGADIASTLSGDIVSDLLTVMITLLNLDFSANALYGVLGAFVLLYLPLYPLRKAALSCASVE